MKLNAGDRYQVNDGGWLTVVSDNGSCDIDISFDSGFKCKARRDGIRDGRVKDRFRPSVCGVGFIGVGAHKARINGKLTKEYQTWSAMLERCYDLKWQKRYPTYIGCTTAIEWHDFQAFAEWFKFNYVEGLQLDKDIILDGNKVYGPQFCKFVSHDENTEKARAKRYRIINPIGECLEVYNLRGFCRENGLSYSAMLKVSRGKQVQHKNWRFK